MHQRSVKNKHIITVALTHFISGNHNIFRGLCDLITAKFMEGADDYIEVIILSYACHGLITGRSSINNVRISHLAIPNNDYKTNICSDI